MQSVNVFRADTIIPFLLMRVVLHLPDLRQQDPPAAWPAGPTQTSVQNNRSQYFIHDLQDIPLKNIAPRCRGKEAAESSVNILELNPKKFLMSSILLSTNYEILRRKCVRKHDREYASTIELVQEE